MVNLRCAIITLCLLAGLQAVALAQPPRRYERTLTRYPQEPYLVHVPQNYDPDRKYPLFIAIHHKGGPAIESYDQWNFLSNRDKYIMLCPEFYGGYQWFRSDEDRKLIAMLGEIKREFPYDPQRVYIVGYSVGGDFVRRFVFENPGYVTKAAILSPRNYAAPPYSGKAMEAKYFISVGRRDEAAYEQTKRFYKEMKTKGYYVIFEEYASLGYGLDDQVKNGVMAFFKND